MRIDASPALGTDYYAIEEPLTDEESGIRKPLPERRSERSLAVESRAT